MASDLAVSARTLPFDALATINTFLNRCSLIGVVPNSGMSPDWQEQPR